jgi:radical SAM superfamily enzyme YgiQ (UPF0313 family)
MDIILVQCKPKNELFDSRYQSENLAMGYLSSSLRAVNFQTGILDAHLLMLEVDEVVKEIFIHKPWMVGFSASAQDTIPATFEVVERLRQSGYEGHITIGGHFPTYEHYKFLENIPYIDSVVRGEGEATIVELAWCIQQNKSISNVKGITYRRTDGKIVVNEDRPLVEDLDTIPLPHRDTMPILLDKNRRISMLASRGCYARCSFCSIQTFFNYRPRRVRSVENVVKEFSILYQQGVRKFKFVDDLFMDPSKRSKQWVLEFCRKIKEANLDDLFMDPSKRSKQWVLEFCRKIKEANLDDLNLWMQVRAVCVSEEIFVALKEIGLKKIFLGLESGHAETLKRYKKDITPEQNVKAVRILKKVEIPEISIGMMPFEPDLSLQGMRENIEFLKTLGTFDIRDVTGRFLPYAGTPLTEQLLQEGKIKRKSWYDIGTYDFTDPKVGQLYQMVRTYYQHAKPSLKAIYKMDSLIRKIEAHFMNMEQKKTKSFFEYQVLRKDVENFIQEHGDMMLSLVEGTIDTIEKEWSGSEEKKWTEKSQMIFHEAESMTNNLFNRISGLQDALGFYPKKQDILPTMHVAEVKVLTGKQIKEQVN